MRKSIDGVLVAPVTIFWNVTEDGRLIVRAARRRTRAMLIYLGRRIAAVIPVVAIVGVLVFLMLRLAPGDPAAVIAGNSASDQDIAQIRTELGLDRPIAVAVPALGRARWRPAISANPIFYKKTVASLIADRARADAGAGDADDLAGDRRSRFRSGRWRRAAQGSWVDRVRDGLFRARFLGAGVRDRLCADLCVLRSSSAGFRCRAISGWPTASAASSIG